MIISVCIVLGSLIIIFGIVTFNGASYISIEMVTQTPNPNDALRGGILNSIIGSMLLALPATGLAFLIGLGIALYLQKDFTPSWFSGFIRFTLDVLWGIPSIVYGIFCFTIMLYFGLGGSILAGIFALTLLEIPIITRYIDEAIKMVPKGLKEGAYSLGSTKFETSMKVIRKQAFPGILSGILLGLGRGIGDTASILFTTKATNRIPTSLLDSTDTLPTTIYHSYQLPTGQPKAYAAAFILLVIVLCISILSRILSKKFTKHVIK